VSTEYNEVKKYAAQLKNEIEETLNYISDNIGLADLVKEPLTQTRRGLNSEISNDTPWPLLPVLVCEAVHGNVEIAFPIASAFQFLFTAAEVFDDIEDADTSDSLVAKYGLAAATSTASTLLILGECSLTRLKRQSLEPEIVIKIIDTINSCYVTACIGQYLDLFPGKQPVTSEEEYLKVTYMKSASQIECVCSVGALSGGANPKLIDLFALFGHNLGMASQLENDIRGISKGKDIISRKITLPVIYALTQSEDKIKHYLYKVFVERAENVTDLATVQELLFHSGAVHYTTVKMENYRQLANDALSDAEKAGIDVGRLKLFLE
jgi:geranylgeranyl pyrophosphate synthase